MAQKKQSAPAIEAGVKPDDEAQTIAQASDVPAVPIVKEQPIEEKVEETPVPVVTATPADQVSGPKCPKCGSTAIGIAGGCFRCNQCGHSSEAPL